MHSQFPDLLFATAKRSPHATALVFRGRSQSYGELADAVSRVAQGLIRHGLQRRDRVAIYLDKRLETVAAMFGAAHAGGVFVPVNPVLKARQVGHILSDCGVRVLVTSPSRLAALTEAITDCPELRLVVLVEDESAIAADPAPAENLGRIAWPALLADGAVARHPLFPVIDTDMAAILYTSGSTGLPKGVVLSHRNLLAGAFSVADYLGNVADDRILSVLPLSFDAGFSQLTTAFAVGARVVLLNYLLAGDVVRAVAREEITGITGIPPLWTQLIEQPWPAGAGTSLRYIANTGGAMPQAVVGRLRGMLPRSQIFLMYGLTESFRSTYLPPGEIDRRPTSIGKAVPNAEILVVRKDGSLCAPNEPGELVHRGAFVTLGYWNDPERTALRFRPAPAQDAALGHPELAVWSGDTVRRDEDGFLYFIGREDEMIKTSGYRVSPTEIEEPAYATGLVGEAVAVGMPDAELGQTVLLVVTAPAGRPVAAETVLAACRAELPAYMVPRRVVTVAAIPRNANGKFDRKALRERYGDAVVTP